jgi:hypothetical protein
VDHDFCCFIFIGFIVLMRIHSKLLLKERLTRRSKKLMKMKSYLEKKTIPFENGLEFNDFHHPYAYDLISSENIPFSKLK